MQIKEHYKVWDDQDRIYAQSDGISIDGERLPGHAPNIVHCMRKEFEKEMLKKATLEQLGNIRKLIDEVIEEKIAEVD